ncbi:Centromere protein mis12 [Leucoagaricus sp. SymC.cos]|nr:Centromere protein mis12 [Leucoagaricus sp. SymC.cos]
MSAPPLLICEALGFSPQLLLDDIINVANQAVQDGVNGMEEFLQKWTDQRAEKLGGDWDGTQEVEQGLVAFQTLLEYHTDIAFDFFEAWSLRNIFAVSSDLPVVLPHQEKLDLGATPERELELVDEIEQLRRKIDAERKLKRVLLPAIRSSAAQRRQSERRYEQLSVLEHPSLPTLASLPAKLEAMHDACSSLEPLDANAVATLTQVELSEPGKRPWESTKSGYLKWATDRLLARAKDKDGESNQVTDLVERVDEVGHAERLRKAIEVTENVRQSLSGTG